MADVRILPEILSNRIAAGEVVERPVSVVKELIENALDAGATRITVEIERGGRDLIRVSDNGSGMSRDNALLAIERYATSKLYTDKDLFSIKTFGFRGEALPSMASVSHFTLVTRFQDSLDHAPQVAGFPKSSIFSEVSEISEVSESSKIRVSRNVGSQVPQTATRIHIKGGTLRDVSDIGAPPGTMIEVKNLYFNTPARRKFLKSINTEMSHIADTFSGMALGNPGVHFALLHNGREVRRFSASSDLKIRAGEILGRESVPHLLGLSSKENDPVQINGYIAGPDLTRSTSQKIWLFVNNRMVTDKGLVAALFRGFQGRIMKGRYPMALLFVSLPFDHVDVNVHPAKLQVRFQNPQQIFTAVTKAVGYTLSDREKELSTPRTFQTPQVSQVSPSEVRPSEVQPSPFAWGRPQGVQEKPLLFQKPSPHGEQEFDNSKFREDLVLVESSNSGREIKSEVASPFEVSDVREANSKNDQEILHPREVLLQGDKRVKGFRILGQIMNTYLVLETNREMVLMDQHAAHERIVFEGLKKRSQAFRPPSQALLVPETLELGFREAELLERILPDLETLGLIVEPFGETTFVIKESPAIMGSRSVKKLVLDMVEQILESGSGVGEKSEKEGWLDDVLILMACHSAIRAGQRLNIQEMEKLVKDLDLCDNSTHCPHGRPIRIVWDARELEKRFKRVL